MTTLHTDALLFDLDGTLVDSSENVEAMWRAWCEKEGVDADALLAVSEGRQGKDVVAEFAPHLDPVEEDRWIIRYQLEQTGGVRAIDGASEMLAELGDEGWGIVTSCVRDLAFARLDGAGLPRPPMIVPADEISESKPHPEGFLTGAERLGVEPSRCIAFEDSVAGLKAAESAGMVGVGITAVTRDTPDARHTARDWTTIAIGRGESSRWSVGIG